MASILTKGTWVVIADGEKALFLENAGDARGPDLRVFREAAQDNPSTREQGVDRPGRRAGPASKSALEASDWHVLGEVQFARDLAAILDRYAQRRLFERLILVAAPNTLGTLRSELHDEVTKRIVAEIPKTLTNHPIAEIEQMIFDHQP